MHRRDHLTFLRESLTNWKDTGSVAPSSSFLARRLTDVIEVRPRLKIVELGPGTGSVTKFLLNILPRDARLVAVELNPVFGSRLASSALDPRCEIVMKDARNLPDILKEKQIEKADYIISGIPLANLDEKTRKEIYAAIKISLKKDGAYTQFQYFMANFSEIKRHFKVSDVAFEWRNLPPAFVYTCKLL